MEVTRSSSFPFYHAYNFRGRGWYIYIYIIIMVRYIMMNSYTSRMLEHYGASVSEVADNTEARSQ